MDYHAHQGSSASRQPAPFDGPGARSILRGEPGPSTLAQSQYSPSMDSATAMQPESQDPSSMEVPSIKRVGGKANVSSACAPCKRAHLACDVARPCKRCVNMGKEDLCADVPHKKRGRPKVPRPSLGEPYYRPGPLPSPSEMTGGVGKWRGPSAYDQPYLTPIDGMPSMSGRTSPGRSMPMDGPFTASDVGPQPFTLFTTTDFKILRASQTTYTLIGYHPNEFVNLNLLDWIHPQDRHLVDLERNNLLAVPYVEETLKSVDVSQAGITQRTELELLSPAEGMREPYPNKNVRVLHSDNHFSPFNVRLHIGGGLGASLWQPSTLGKVYLVASFLAIPPRVHGADAQGLSSRSSQVAPPTPLTPGALGGPEQGGLPSFSSIAAGVEPPQPLYDRPSLQPYYPPGPSSSSGRPLSSHQSYAQPPYPPSSVPQSGYPSLPPSQPFPPHPSRAASAGYPRRSPSPSSAYRTSQTATYHGASNAPEYAMHPGYYPPLSAGLPPPPPPPHGDYRRASYEDWRGLPPPNSGGLREGGAGSTSGNMPLGDGSRRTWEL